MTAAKKPAAIEVREIPVDELIVSADETRKTIDQAALKELADSIAVNGVIEALLVRPLRAVVVELEDGSEIDYPPMSREKCSELIQRPDVVRTDIDDRYCEIVAGQRRWLASKLAGRTTCPCIVREMPDDEARALRMVSNLQREDLPPMEEAEAQRAERAKLAEKVKREREYRGRLFAAIAQVSDAQIDAPRLALLTKRVCLAVLRGSAPVAGDLAPALGWEPSLFSYGDESKLEAQVRSLTTPGALRAAVLRIVADELGVGDYTVLRGLSPERMEQVASWLGIDVKAVRSGKRTEPTSAARPAKKPVKTAAKPKKTVLTAAARKRIAAAQRKRLQAAKKGGKR